MAKTSTMTVNDAASPEILTASVKCKKITVYESPEASGWPRRWQYRMPGAADTAVPVAEGGSHVFEKPDNRFYGPNEQVAHLELLAGGGSTTFCVVEE